MEFEKDVSLKYWYLFNYPEDELGLEMNADATFAGLITQIFGGFDIYEYIGVYDSLVRERLFVELSRQLNKPYKFVYDMWLKMDEYDAVLGS